MADYDYFRAIPLSSFNTASITSSFKALNGSGFNNPVKILRIHNAGSVGMTLSYDGSVDHEFIAAGATIHLDLQTNHADNSAYGAGTLVGRKGLIVYGKGTAGTGNLYISGYF